LLRRLYVSDEKGKISVPFRWSLGARSQTWVLEYEGKLYESLVSYYSPIDGLGTTIGDQSIQPRTLLEALGRELSDFEAKACFECHATGAVVDRKLKLESLTAGVRCEHCHAGAEAHGRAISQGKRVPAPEKLGAMSAEGDFGVMRPMPSDVGAGRPRPPSWSAECPVSAVPAGE
jgi:hypothetical protein